MLAGGRPMMTDGGYRVDFQDIRGHWTG